MINNIPYRARGNFIYFNEDKFGKTTWHTIEYANPTKFMFDFTNKVMRPVRNIMRIRHDT